MTMTPEQEAIVEAMDALAHLLDEHGDFDEGLEAPDAVADAVMKAYTVLFDVAAVA
jgi:hypothetical protein